MPSISACCNVNLNKSRNGDMKKKSDGFNFGENLQGKILSKYKSVSAFAKETGINKKTLDGWLGPGARFPSKPEYIKSMAQALDLTVHELLFGSVDNRESLAEIFEKTEIFGGVFEISIKKVTKKD